MTKRKHYKEIIAFAEGYDIETRISHISDWEDDPNPSWFNHHEYRVKDPYQKFKEAQEAGKMVQYKSVITDEWHDAGKLAFCEDVERYRVKPEPVYVPFEWEDREQLRGKWIKHILNENEMCIVSVAYFSNTLYISSVIDSNILFRQYVFLDGTPCGKIKSE